MHWLFSAGENQNLGVVHVAGQLAFQVLVSPLLKKPVHPESPRFNAATGSALRPPNQAASSDVSSVNAPDTIELLNRLAPDVIVACRNQNSWEETAWQSGVPRSEHPCRYYAALPRRAWRVLGSG